MFIGPFDNLPRGVDGDIDRVVDLLGNLIFSNRSVASMSHAWVLHVVVDLRTNGSIYLEIAPNHLIFAPFAPNVL